ncbi:MAG: response regulator [Promethearchaeota archaeon]
MKNQGKIFIIEDDYALQKLYAIMLNDAGFKIIDTCDNGEEAILKYKNFQEKPDVIILDHRMPIKNGIDTLVEILQINRNEKIIFTSADLSVKEKAISLGAIEFVEKPFDLQYFLKKVTEIINN